MQAERKEHEKQQEKSQEKQQLLQSDSSDRSSSGMQVYPVEAGCFN